MPDDSRPVYFKIHGSADQKDTMVYTLKQEGELAQWKYDLLNTIVSDKTVIFIGYSGKDFDICPMIAFEHRYKKILWLHYGDLNTLSAYAHHLLNSSESNLLVTGDFCEMLRSLFGLSLNCTMGNSKFTPRFALTPGELLRWRLSILDRLAYPNLGMPLLEANKDQLTTQEYLAFKSSFCAHHGRYRDTALICLKRAGDKSLDISARVHQLISAAGTYSTYGHYVRSWYYARKAMRLFEKHANDVDSEVLVLRMRLTFMMTLNQYYDRLKFRRRQLKLKAKAKVIYNKLYELLIHSGDWTERQIVQHMAERLHLPFPEKPRALTSNIGYRNLGMPGMDIINIKDLVRSGDPQKEQDGLRLIDGSLVRAIKLGMYTESWKHARLKIKKKHGLTRTEVDRCFKIWWGNLNKCQYFWPLKLHHLADYWWTRRQSR